MTELKKKKKKNQVLYFPFKQQHNKLLANVGFMSIKHIS